MGDKHTGTEHLLLGILREETSRAAKILHEHGRLQAVREELMRSSQEKLHLQNRTHREPSVLAEFSRDVTQAAVDGLLDPMIGRESELQWGRRADSLPPHQEQSCAGR